MLDINLQFFGGRGAASGKSDKGNDYGTQYKTLLKYGAVKFVKKNSRQSEPLMETMTKNRIYATIGGNNVNAITFFDNKNKRAVVLERDKNKNSWHKHYGYEHSENSKNKHDTINKVDKEIIEKIKKIWDNK